MASEIYHIVFTVYTAVNCNTAKNKPNITNIVIITFLYCNWKQKKQLTSVGNRFQRKQSVTTVALSQMIITRYQTYLNSYSSNSNLLNKKGLKVTYWAKHPISNAMHWQLFNSFVLLFSQLTSNKSSQQLSFISLLEQGVALTVRNTTGPPCSVTVQLCGTEGRLFATDVSAKFKVTWQKNRANIRNPAWTNLDIVP